MEGGREEGEREKGKERRREGSRKREKKREKKGRKKRILLESREVHSRRGARVRTRGKISAILNCFSRPSSRTVQSSPLSLSR